MVSTRWQLFLSFLKIGATSFGGGPSAISMMQQELTENTQLTDNDFFEGLGLGNSLPGPIITNMAVYAGMKLDGLTGALIAVMGAVLPSMFIMAGGVYLVMNFHDLPMLKAAMKAIKPAVVALLAFTIYKLAPASYTSSIDLLIGAVVLAMLIILKVNPAIVVILSGLAGIIIYR